MHRVGHAGAVGPQVPLASPPIARALIVSASAALIALALYAFSRSFLETLAREDGVVEYLTAALYLLAAALLAESVLHRRYGRWWSALFAVGFLFVAGEEISWGQRLLGISTPEGLRESNVQEELTLHNLDGVHGSIRLLGFMVFLLLYVALPLAVRRDDGVARLAERVAFPVPPLWLAPVTVVGLAFMVGPRLFGSVVYSLDEVGELYLAFAAIGYAWSMRHTGDRGDR